MQLAAQSRVFAHDFRVDRGHPEDWVEARGSVLRELTGRRVFRARAGGLETIVKEFEPRGRLFGLRAYAATEASRALEVAGRGVPVVEPLGWARLGDGRERLFLRLEAGARTLHSVVLDGGTRGTERHALARRVGVLIARLQNAGIRHHDPHAGNVLVRPDGALLFADAHPMRPGHGLRLSQRARDLARFGLFFLTHGTRVDQLLFWGAYGRAAELGPEMLEDLRREVLARIPAAFTRLSLSRARRELRCGHPVREGAFSGVVFGDLAPRVLRDVVRTAGDLRPGAHVLKASRTAWTFLAGGDHVGKVFLPKKATRPFRDLLRGTRAERAVRASHALLHRGFRGPEVVALLRDGRLARRSILVMRRVTDALPLEDALSSLSPPRAREAAEMLGRALRRMHDRGLRHRDLKKDNLWLAPDGNGLRFLDLDGVRQLRRPLDWARRARDLANLDGSLHDFRAVPARLRLRALVAYLGGDTRAGFASRVAELGRRTRARRLASRPASAR